MPRTQATAKINQNSVRCTRSVRRPYVREAARWPIIRMIDNHNNNNEIVYTPHATSKRNGSHNRRDKLLHILRNAAGGHPDSNDAVANAINPIQDCCWVPCRLQSTKQTHSERCSASIYATKFMYCLLASRSLVGVGLKLCTFKRLNLPFNFRRQSIRKHTHTMLPPLPSLLSNLSS